MPADAQGCRGFRPRVKAMCSLEVLGQRVLVTASSDGFIKTWRLSQDPVGVPQSDEAREGPGERLVD